MHNASDPLPQSVQQQRPVQPEGRQSQQVSRGSAGETPQTIDVSAGGEKGGTSSEVSEFIHKVDSIRAHLEDKSNQFRAGQIRHALSEWETITDDKEMTRKLYVW